MLDIKEIFNNMKKREVPKITFESKYMEEWVSRWLLGRVAKTSEVSEKFGVILMRLGFSSEDEIILCNYNEELSTFQYIVNGKGPYYGDSISLYDYFSEENPEIYISRGSTRYQYECFRDANGEIIPNFTLVSYDVQFSNDILYHRILSLENACYVIKSGAYSLEFLIGKPLNLENKGAFKLVNEDKLVEYLSSLVFPIKIDEVYKRICDISLGDISKYPLLSIEVTKYNLNVSGSVITDLILLRDGELVRFGMTKDEKTIIVDANGSWEYDTLESTVSFSVTDTDDNIGLNLRAKTKGNIDDYTTDSAYNDMTTARKEVDLVRRKVSETFNWRKRNR